MTAPVDRWGDPLDAATLPCAGKAQLFESEKVQDRSKAIALCGGCPANWWCERERQATVAEFGIAVGVWAGRAWTERDYRVKDAA